MTEQACTHCKKPLGSKYSFSYGMPGIEQVFGCDRFLCKKKRIFHRKFRGVIRNSVLPYSIKLTKWLENQLRKWS